MIVQQETTTLSPRQPLSGRRAIISGSARRAHESSDGYNKLKVCTVNVGTMRGRSREVVSMLKRRQADICCVQEVRYKNKGSMSIGTEEEKYKLWYSGNEEGTGGVGVLLCQRLVQNVIEVERFSDRCMKIRLVLGRYVYVPQVGRSNEEKDQFRDELEDIISNVPDRDGLIIAGDLNCHIGSNRF